MTERRRVPGRAHTDEQKRALVEKLLAAWTTPRARELRLGQLIANSGVRDLFVVEDSELADLVETFANG